MRSRLIFPACISEASPIATLEVPRWERVILRHVKT